MQQKLPNPSHRKTFVYANQPMTNSVHCFNPKLLRSKHSTVQGNGRNVPPPYKTVFQTQKNVSKSLTSSFKTDNVNAAIKEINPEASKQGCFNQDKQTFSKNVSIGRNEKEISNKPTIFTNDMRKKGVQDPASPYYRHKHCRDSRYSFFTGPKPKDSRYNIPNSLKSRNPSLCYHSKSYSLPDFPVQNYNYTYNNNNMLYNQNISTQQPLNSFDVTQNFNNVMSNSFPPQQFTSKSSYQSNHRQSQLNQTYSNFLSTPQHYQLYNSNYRPQQSNLYSQSLSNHTTLQTRSYAHYTNYNQSVHNASASTVSHQMYDNFYRSNQGSNTFNNSQQFSPRNPSFVNKTCSNTSFSRNHTNITSNQAYSFSQTGSNISTSLGSNDQSVFKVPKPPSVSRSFDQSSTMRLQQFQQHVDNGSLPSKQIPTISSEFQQSFSNTESTLKTRNHTLYNLENATNQKHHLQNLNNNTTKGIGQSLTNNITDTPLNSQSCNLKFKTVPKCSYNIPANSKTTTSEFQNSKTTNDHDTAQSWWNNETGSDTASNLLNDQNNSKNNGQSLLQLLEQSPQQTHTDLSSTSNNQSVDNKSPWYDCNV